MSMRLLGGFSVHFLLRFVVVITMSVLSLITVTCSAISYLSRA